MITKYQVAADKNERKSCSVYGCPYNRHGVSKYCQKHLRRSRKYGHPTQQPLQTKHYQEQLDDVTGLINRNKDDHPGIQSALDFFQQWLDKAADDKPVPAAKHLRRALRKGVTALDMLCEAAAVQHFRDFSPRTFKDESAYVFAMGRAMMKLGAIKELYVTRNGTSFGLYPKHTEVKATGDYVLQSIGALLLNISQSIHSREEQQERRRRAMWQSFDHWPTQDQHPI